LFFIFIFLKPILDCEGKYYSIILILLVKMLFKETSLPTNKSELINPFFSQIKSNETGI